MTTASILVITTPAGKSYGVAGGAAEAELALTRGWVRPAATMWVSTAGAQIDLMAPAALPSGVIAPALAKSAV